MQPSPTTREQFVELVNTHQGILHRICSVFGRSSEDRQDLFHCLKCIVVWGIKVWLAATP